MTDRVQVISDISWSFRDHGTGAASVSPKVGTRYSASIEVDPFPGYGHHSGRVLTTLERVEAAFPLPEPFAPTYFLLEHEVVSRTNGQQGIEIDYNWTPPEDDPKDDAHQRPWHGYVVLSGKRIPPHPAMTRYLVAHEYGHVVEDWLIRGRREPVYSRTLLNEYAELRGVDPSISAGGRTWHLAIQEIFACDFRVLVAKIEREFWPHPGIERPEELPKIRAWWRRQVPR